jgi:hypothetical protein
LKTRAKSAVAVLTKASALIVFACTLAATAAAEGDDRDSGAQHTSRPVVATLPTHLGAPVVNLITLWCFPTDTPDALSGYPHCTSFRQVDSAGVMATTDYTVPAGHTLVILDIDWESTFNPANSTIFLNFPCTSGCGFLYSSSTTADSQGIAARQDHLTAGLYLTYIPVVLTSGPHLSEVQLHGYLTP